MSTPFNHTTASNDDVITFRRIRKAIGVLGMALPVTLLLLSLIPFFKTNGIQPSISHYYYTNLREIFTGILCAVGLFLIRYKGHSNPDFFRNDGRLTNIAGIMAFGIAFMPTTPLNNNWSQKVDTLVPLPYEWLGYIHYGFAGLFFLTLALISINVFTIGQQKNEGITKSIWNENNIYRICGTTIILSMILCFLADHYHWFRYSTIFFETIMLFAFGISWLIKGRILGDSGTLGEKLYCERNPK